ncbi:MAG TPA: FAD-dependent oxidoreductase [Acidimicrobiia bacterium]
MTDFLVIGGGMAGVSAAAHLAHHGKVVLLEAESTLAYHTTGRSAALFVVNYGGYGTRPLAAASSAFFDDPPEDAVDSPLLTDRGLLWIADEARMDQLRALAVEPQPAGYETILVDAATALEMVPRLRPEKVAGGLVEPQARDIDVAGLHQAFVRIARRHGAEIVTSAPVTSIRSSGTGWEVAAGGTVYHTGAVIDAAGAWGDRVAAIAGVPPIGLEPRRRTAFMVPGSLEYSAWPFVIDVDHLFYFKPDGTQILCSLAEEEPDEPGDPRPRMEDVALAIERINEVTDLDIRTVNSQWTGLRTFSSDGELVIGEDPEAPGFYWLVGLGGIGIATSPAYGSLLASLATGSDLDPALVAAGVDPGRLSPARFRERVAR